MALFQNSVLKKYLQLQDQQKVEQAYKKFISFFQDTAIQQNIRESKEEQFQEGFLRELFVKVLGYTLNPEPDYNLTTEFKNQTGAKKADGAILKDGKALVVIELKSTKTRDLEAVRQQAFDYKANQQSCVYVITSNFEKIRFYINNAVEFEEFDLFNITAERFELLYLCLAKDSLLNNLPLKIKEASILEEDAISKKFYADYSLFKRELYNDIVQRNLKISNLHGLEENQIKKFLFKKTQKLLDRLLFILFSEDKGLLPPNSISKILEQWLKLKELDEYRSLYSRFIKYFGYLNAGWKGKEYEIYAYNGGLFLQDSILDNLTIDDELLYKQTQRLTAYDFESEVDVNILGHIFEHSLAEIENITALLEGREVDKAKTKRKKEGIFYTPKYITKYIVDNTVGKLCEEKKTELDIVEEDFNPKRRKETKKNLKGILDKYRKWLLELTILDPACGSGAFLNQALDFLISEHHYIDELYAQLYGSSIVFQDIENQILENNIYGVDINEESVDIARLSLWLRTAQKGRKLTTLNNNIKCGNSLIDDPEVAGDKAFKWEKEFPDVFAKGGFDVVIGNPPYVRQELLGDFKEYFSYIYKVFEGTSDLFAYFYEKSFQLLKNQGFFGFISNTFDKTKAANKLREFLKSEVRFDNYVDFTEVQIFEGATTYPIILVARNEKAIANNFDYIRIPKTKQSKVIDIYSEKSIEVEQLSLNSESWNFNSIQGSKLLDRIKEFKTIREEFGKCFRGIVTGYNDAFIIDKKTKEQLETEHPSTKELIKPFYEGKDLSKWHSPIIEKYIIFTRRGTVIDNYPAIKKHLENYKERLTPRNSPDQKIGRKPGKYEWFEIQDSVDYFKVFEDIKITWPNLQAANKFCTESKGYYINAPSVVFPSDNKGLLCILNSKLIWFYFKSICVIRSGGYIEVKPQYFEQVPIPEIKNEDKFEELANKIIENTADFQSLDGKFLKYVKAQLSIDRLSKKLQNWQKLEFGEFIKELNKAIKIAEGDRLTKSDELEWMEVFEKQKEKSQQLQTEIDKTEREIDQMVYELYGLSEEEIKIVE